MTRNVATVFGGSGFIGRYVVQRLAARGHTVRVVGRHTERVKNLVTTGGVGQVVALYGSFANPGTLVRAIEGADLVVNLVGILAEQKAGDFQRLQADGPGVIARGAAQAGVRRLVQISAIGADPGSPSLYARTKAAGEQAAREAMPGTVVLRPLAGIRRGGQVLQPVRRDGDVFADHAGDQRRQPVPARLRGRRGRCDSGRVSSGTMPSGAPMNWAAARIYTFRELLAWILHETRRHRALVTIPPGLARLQAKIGEMIPGKPFTQDQLTMLERDNVVGTGSLGLSDLGIVPTPVELIVPGYLDRYRPGGGKREEAPVA